MLERWESYKFSVFFTGKVKDENGSMEGPMMRQVPLPTAFHNHPDLFYKAGQLRDENGNEVTMSPTSKSMVAAALSRTFSVPTKADSPTSVPLHRPPLSVN